MAWTAIPTAITGQSWSAFDENTYVKANLDTLFPYTGTLQVAYSNSTNTLTVLSVPTSQKQSFIRNASTSTSTLIFGSMIAARIARASSYWSRIPTASTSTTQTTYYPTNTSKMYCGEIYSPAYPNCATITFPENFTNLPLVIISAMSALTSTETINVTATSIAQAALLNNASVKISWIAVGE